MRGFYLASGLRPQHGITYFYLWELGIFINFAIRLPRCGVRLFGVLAAVSGSLATYFRKAYIDALFLAAQNLGHSEISPKNNATIDATGMYIPIRAHFKHLHEMGLGYLHITAWSLLFILVRRQS